MKKRKSFTLVELILSIVLLTIIGLPLALLMIENTKNLAINNNKIYASQLARLELEKIANTDYVNITSASFSFYQGYDYNLTRTVTYQAGREADPESLKRVEIEVYAVGNATAITKFITYRAKNVVF